MENLKCMPLGDQRDALTNICFERRKAGKAGITAKILLTAIAIMLNIGFCNASPSAYTVVVRPYEDHAAVGIDLTRTVSATVMKRSDDSPVDNVLVYFSATRGNFSPSPVETDAGGEAATTFTAPHTAGTTTVTATVTILGVPYTGETILKVIGGEFVEVNDHDLRYYCGEPSSEYGTVTAPVQPSGTTWTWTTSEGITAIEQTAGTSAGIPDAKIVAVAGTTPTRGVGHEWVKLTYKYEEYVGTDVTWNSSVHEGYTSYKPSSVVIVPDPETGLDYVTFEVPIEGSTNPGYQTQVYYQLLNQFNSPVKMSDVPLNESFGAFTNDISNNWPTLTTRSDSTNSNAEFFDVFGTTGGAYAFSPPMAFTGNPPTGTTKVSHSTQTIRAGSLTPGLGCTVQTVTVQYYTDHATTE